MLLRTPARNDRRAVPAPRTGNPYIGPGNCVLRPPSRTGRTIGIQHAHGAVLPFLKTEIGVAYRSETRLGGDLKVRMWPVTGSLWLAPLPMLYAGGGVGWYHTTFDYAPALAIANETKERFGVHLGGGIE